MGAVLLLAAVSVAGALGAGQRLPGMLAPRIGYPASVRPAAGLMPARRALQTAAGRSAWQRATAETMQPPRIVQKPIPFTAARRRETAAYAQQHYGLNTWRLKPRVIVEHYTVNESFQATWNTFAADTPDPELHQLPGDCAHFVVDKNGTVYQLVPTTIICRHTVGLNYTAIGIEHVGMTAGEILSNPRQLAASLRLTAWLMLRHRIPLGDVIGHAESLTSPYHRELYRPWRCQTHADWTRPEMDVYRRKLVALAGRLHVPLGRRLHRVVSSC